MSREGLKKSICHLKPEPSPYFFKGEEQICIFIYISHDIWSGENFPLLGYKFTPKPNFQGVKITNYLL